MARPRPPRAKAGFSPSRNDAIKAEDKKRAAAKKSSKK